LTQPLAATGGVFPPPRKATVRRDPWSSPPLPDRRYSATLQGDEEKPEQYEVFASQLARSRIAANIRIGASLGVKEWAVMRYSLATPDLLLVDYLEGQGLPQVPGAKLNEALRRRWDEPGVFKPYLVCARTKPNEGDKLVRPSNDEEHRHGSVRPRC
jgi:hypothetical protein